MRTIPPAIWRLWEQGGPFVGDNKAHGRVTVERDWFLNTTSDVTTADPRKYPFRWFQRWDNSQTETEVPNIKQISIDRSLDADAATCDITVYNQEMDANVSGQSQILGKPGVFTWRIPDKAAVARWAQLKGPWADVLIPNALLRTYQGFGGHDKAMAQAIADGNLVLTGVWLIDEVRPGTDGMLNIKCRDMAKLLIEQQLYPPLVPAALYPLDYHRWTDTYILQKAVPYYDYTDPVEYSPSPPEGPKYVTDIAMGATDKGYWILGTDGGVFAELETFYGSRGGEYAEGGFDDAPMMGIAGDPLGRGYWLVSSNGAVYTFGEVQFYGGMHGQSINAPIAKITAHPDGRGYWLVGEDGAVYAFGSAQVFGTHPPTNGRKVVDLCATKSGNGYWLLSDNGGVFAYGDAPFHGGYTDNSDNLTVAMASTPNDAGYWIVRRNGDVSPFGDAPWAASNGPWEWDNSKRVLNDPIFSIASTHSGYGYVLVGGDGGVFSFGNAPFSGSLPGDWMGHFRTEGNYKDYVDIIRDLLLWSGWLLYGTGKDDVYGNLEATGIYAEDQLPQEMFDKKPVIDGINSIKEIVGYHFWVDDEGAAHFESPNWFNVGNFMEDGSHVNTVPEIDEARQLTDYSVSFTDRAMRSEIIVTTYDPTAHIEGTMTARVKVDTPGVDLIRGMVRPLMTGLPLDAKLEEAQRMAELIALHIQRSLRLGSASCVANPAIQINDQVRIQERNTNETYIHYVRGIRTDHDLDSGVWTMQLTTNWLVSDQA